MSRPQTQPPAERLERPSPCKINLLLNILGRRPDGYHELESVIQPVPCHDRLSFQTLKSGLELTCSDPSLPTDQRNLVHRAATAFLSAAQLSSGVCIHLEKRLPLAAGMGGGSANAATTLRALNELFGHPLPPATLHQLAASLGSDVPFFLQDQPALATGRGECLAPCAPFAALRGVWALLVHPGFGIATAWAYQSLARHPDALQGQPGRGAELVRLLQETTLSRAGRHFYNALEAPALQKYPILALYQEFLRAEGALATLMSGSGSTTFALAAGQAAAEALREKFRARFGLNGWTVVVPLGA